MFTSAFDHHAWADHPSKPLSNGQSRAMAFGFKIDEVTDPFGDAFAKHTPFDSAARAQEAGVFDVTLFLEDSILQKESSPIISQPDSSAVSPMSGPACGLFDEEPEQLRDWSLDSIQTPVAVDPFYDFPARPAHETRKSSTSNSSYLDFMDLDAFSNRECDAEAAQTGAPARTSTLANLQDSLMKSTNSWIESRSDHTLSISSEEDPYNIDPLLQPTSINSTPRSSEDLSVYVGPTRLASAASRASKQADQNGKSSSTSTSQIPNKAAGRKRKRKEISASESIAKRERFLERNRLAAKKCREKKKGSTSGLQTQMRALEKDRFQIVMAIEELRAEAAALMEQLRKHRDCGHAGLDGVMKGAAVVKETEPEPEPELEPVTVLPAVSVKC